MLRHASSSTGPRSVPSRSLAMAGLLLGLALVWTLGGCAGFGGGGAGGRERKVSLDLDDAALAELGFRREWQGFPYVPSGGRLEEIMVDHDRGVVLARESGSAVSALDDDSGRQRWRSRLATRLTRFVSIKAGVHRGRDTAIVSSEADIFLLDLDTGNLVGRQTYEKVVNSGPVLLGGGRLAYGTASGEVLIHDLNVSNKLWGHDLPGSIDQAPVLVNGAIGAVASQGHVVFLDQLTGALWSNFKIFGGTETRPIATDSGLMVVASVDQSLWAFDPRAGRIAWRVRTPSALTAQPSYHAGTVYCTIPDRGLTAFDASNGEELWNNQELTGTVIGINSQRLLVWDGSSLATVSPSNGSLQNRAELPTVRHATTDRFEDGNLYLADNAGSIAKLIPLY